VCTHRRNWTIYSIHGLTIKKRRKGEGREKESLTPAKNRIMCVCNINLPKRGREKGGRKGR